MTGGYAGVTSSLPFLQPTLSYDANNAYLALTSAASWRRRRRPARPPSAPRSTPRPRPAATSRPSWERLATQSTPQGRALLTSLSGMQLLGLLQLDGAGRAALHEQLPEQAGGRGGNRVALAEACDVACDATTAARWGAWGGALGGLGTVGANQSLGGVTYNVGGFAAGLDRAITDSFRLGVTAGYAGRLAVGVGLRRPGLLADRAGRPLCQLQPGPGLSRRHGGLRLQRQPAGAQHRHLRPRSRAPRRARPAPTRSLARPRAAGASVLAGRRSFVTPFARVQAYTGTQNAFTETGAQSLDLNVAAQTTSSLRTVLGAQVGGSVDLGWRGKLNGELRLGWSHEYADISRPVWPPSSARPPRPSRPTGQPAARQRGHRRRRQHRRRRGDLALSPLRRRHLGQDTSHALTAGVRMTW